ncbi:hypothetical protein BU23DRAFT_567451 [Bimuria novae-zelandiae CBS 107.79]|uniref:Swi5-domain-containing protein n=1 Tax=Bimuria novae-zelandiae CBS 107.79 TaxID=1447943 RepID=A0A6A5VBX6_9PLEO|nr:hypothetical protein BU23DRAFT_567451 [Bimuria novae-zelandiae CBS 107.79]
MAVEKEVTEVPDSEEEPLTSSPKMVPHGILEQLDGAAQEPSLDTSPRTDGSLDESQISDAKEVMDHCLRGGQHQVTSSDLDPSETNAQANPQAHTLEEYTNDHRSALENTSSSTDICNSSSKQSNVPSGPVSQPGANSEQGQPADPTGGYDEMRFTAAIEEGAIDGAFQTIADIAPLGAPAETEGLPDLLHLDEAACVQQDQEKLCVHPEQAPEESEQSSRVGKESQENSTHTLSRDRGSSCPPELAPGGPSCSAAKYACARSVTTDGTSQARQRDSIESSMSSAGELKDLIGDVVIAENSKADVTGELACSTSNVERQMAGSQTTPDQDYLRIDVDASSTPDHSGTASAEAMDQPAALPVTDMPSLENVNTTSRDGVEALHNTSMYAKVLTGEETISVKGQPDSSATNTATCPEPSQDARSFAHAPSSATSTHEDTQPAPAKSAQEITLAELKAQRASLIASLAALPSIRGLIAQSKDSCATSQPTNTKPTESEILAAAHKLNKKHIKLLHEYNEMKDVGQGLMGLIADQRGVRIVEVQDEFGIDTQD